MHAFPINLYLYEFFELISFLTPWTTVHDPKIGHFKGKQKSDISETRKATPTKLGVQAFHINLYLHEFFELILFFDTHGYSPWFEREIWPFLKASKELNLAMPMKIGLHVFHINLYLHEFFQLILFFDPLPSLVHMYTLWSS